MLRSGQIMATKSILLAVAEPQALVDITQALGTDWEATSVASEDDALAQLEKRAFDALLVDFNLGSPDASELINQALGKRPETVRFLLVYEADLALVAAKVEGTPQILPKPADPASLKSRIETAVSESVSKQSESQPAEAAAQSPAIPPLYSEVLKALDSPEVTPEHVAEIIARDADLTGEVLRLTNSSYLGLPRNISSPVEAVESLGLETVKALVMALQFLAEHSRSKPAYLSFDQVWEHSIRVGQIARDLVLFETKDRTLASQALTAGMLHDLGKVVLVTNFDDLYGRVHSLARKQPVTLWDVEKEMFGANHGEIGGCLLGMWNMPAAIIEAAALHHEPPLGEQQQLTPLAAVHIANVLERELRPSNDDVMVAPIINTPFLNEIGLLQRLPVWRAAFANRRSTSAETEEPVQTDQSASTLLSSSEGSRTANHLPNPATGTRTATSRQSRRRNGSSGANQKRWAYAGITAGLLLLLALWLETQPELNQTEPAYARTPMHQIPAVVASVPSIEKSTAAAPQVTAPATLSEEPSAPAAPTSASATLPTQASTEPKLQGSQASPEPISAPPKTVETPVTNVPPPNVVPQEKLQPEFRVNAIIYTAHPSAIVNGQIVYIGDQVNDATVVAIGKTSVTLQLSGQRKTYPLR
jgi:HD-like signal output (HDOD) protein